MKANQKGFSVVEILIVVVIVGLLGAVGWLVYDRQKSQTGTKDTTAQTTTKSEAPKKETATVKDPYEGWKTYKSVLNSNLSFKYPADWEFEPATTAPTPNDLGGVENNSVLRSAKIQGTYGTVTNQYMCVSIDEYSANGWKFGNWSFGKELSSEQVTVGGKSVTLSTYAGDTHMQSELILHEANNSAGNHFVSTKNNFVVSVKAAFNFCQQPLGGQGITNQQADFNAQPETDIAKKIIKSIQF